MQYRFRFAAISCLAIAAIVTLAKPIHAQESGREFAPTQLNASRLRWLQYRLVAGRVVASSNYPEGMNVSFGPSIDPGQPREHLQLLILDNKTRLKYELADDGQKLSIVLADSGEFMIRRHQQTPDRQMLFSQTPGEPLSLAITQGSEQRLLTGASFWHLYLSDPELVTAELIPYLELLRPAWNLASTGSSIEDSLVHQAREPQAFTTPQVARLVVQLGSSRYSEREAAQRELVQLGQSVLPFLEELSKTQLDAEQAARLKQVVGRLSADYEDTVERVTAWLAGDWRVWAALLQRPDLATRRIALKRLEDLTAATIEFDPDGDEKSRQEQLSRLRLKLENATLRR